MKTKDKDKIMIGEFSLRKFMRKNMAKENDIWWGCVGVNSATSIEDILTCLTRRILDDHLYASNDEQSSLLYLRYLTVTLDLRCSFHP